jgi:hypothetical protein
MINPDDRFSLWDAAGLYRSILSEIEAAIGDVFSRRAHVRKLKDLSLLPGVWLRSPFPLRVSRQMHRFEIRLKRKSTGSFLEQREYESHYYGG